MKQTAVEWLFEKLDIVDSSIMFVYFEQAKEMEKQQMRDASCPYVGGWEDEEFEYWYNETFKNTEQ
jgi:hypothetical protein